MRVIGIQESGPAVLQIDNEAESRVCKDHIDLRPGIAVGMRGWERYIGGIAQSYFDFHGIFIKAPVRSIAHTIVEKWPDGVMWWKNIANRPFFLRDHNSGMPMLPDTAFIFELRSWPWTIITGTMNGEANGGFDKRVGDIARYLQGSLNTDVIAVSNSGSLELCGDSEKYVFFKEDNDGEAEGVLTEWMEARGLFVPPFYIDTVDGFLRMRIVGIPRKEIGRIDLMRNLNVS